MSCRPLDVESFRNRARLPKGITRRKRGGYDESKKVSRTLLMADGKCRVQKGRPRFLGARTWVAPPAPTEPQTAAPRRCVDSGSCPEPENHSVSLRFSL